MGNEAPNWMNLTSPSVVVRRTNPPSVNTVVLLRMPVVAVYSLDNRNRVCHFGRRGFVSPCSKRQTALHRYLAWVHGCCGLLDLLDSPSRSLLSPFWNVQQNVWHARRRHCADGLALLDRFCVASRCRTKCRTGEAKDYATKALRASE